MGRYNYPRRHSKLEGERNLPGGLPSYKSYDTGAGFSKKPTVVGGQEGPLGDLGSQQEMRRLLKAGRPIDERESTSLVLI